ncbi:ATP-binding protein, partial [Nocardioides sp.]|uniref:sensor histidine kinase n=1 Tax=Nocardioides sp. TaxID=35761 RepID=UPI002B272331
RGTFSISTRPELLAPLLADAVAPLVSLARQRCVELTLTPVSESALCDGDRVIQAVVNLVGNALKFTPSGGAVTVSTSDTDQGVVVAITDTGRGIPAHELSSIFERFHQVRTGDDRRHVGAGLGLTITKHIVEAQGGRLWVESTVGVGSTFRFTLPHVVEEAEQAATAPPEAVSDLSAQAEAAEAGDGEAGEGETPATGDRVRG